MEHTNFREHPQKITSALSVMKTKTYESDIIFRMGSGMNERITNCSNEWILSIRGIVGVRCAICIECGPGNISWNSASITIRQHETCYGTVVFTHRNLYSCQECAAFLYDGFTPLNEFRVTIIETYDEDDTVTSDVSSKVAHILPEANFSQPDELSNTILVIDDKRIHVNNYFLATHSPFFKKLFFGEFAENGKEEVVLEHLEYNSFIEFLRFIHPDGNELTRKNVEAVLSVASYTLCRGALNKCIGFLTTDKTFPLLEKLCIADKYQLNELMDSLFAKMTAQEAKSVAKEGVDKFSVHLKASFYDIFVKLILFP